MNTKFYKYCAVPMCTNTTVRTPDKLFIHVPSKKAIRKKWLALAYKDTEAKITTSNNKYFCEDHFDLPKDMENYMKYRIMGAVSIIRMRPGCLPTKFECQHQASISHTGPGQPVLQNKRSNECSKEPEDDKLDPKQCADWCVDVRTSASAVKIDRKWYSSCMVPQCRNTTASTPGKIFIKVPHEPKTRLKWLQLARRDAVQLSPKSSLYCCEDHFDLPNDMQNYMRYKVMGSVKATRMVPGCLPSRFDCQPDRRKRFCYKTTRPLALKRQRAELVQEAVKSMHFTSYVPTLEKKKHVNRSVTLDTSESSLADQVKAERDYSASDADPCPEAVEGLREKRERECASERDGCREDTAQEFVRVKEEMEVDIEVELGPELLQPQDVCYSFNTPIKTEPHICKLEFLEDSGGSAYTQIDIDTAACQNYQAAAYPASLSSIEPNTKYKCQINGKQNEVPLEGPH